jgi:hypothetical protein
VCPAPFFAAEVPVPAGGELTYRYQVIVADDELDIDGCEALRD